MLTNFSRLNDILERSSNCHYSDMSLDFLNKMQDLYNPLDSFLLCMCQE